MASDIEVVNRIRAGDSAALAELYDRYLPVMDSAGNVAQVMKAIHQEPQDQKDCK